MNLIKMFKMFTGGISSTRSTVGKSFKTIDDIIEKEYITGSIDKVKEMSGDIVQKAGELMERGKMKVEELQETDVFEPIGEAIESYKEKVSDINEVIKDKIIDVKQKVFDEEE